MAKKRHPSRGILKSAITIMLTRIDMFKHHLYAIAVYVVLLFTDIIVG